MSQVSGSESQPPGFSDFDVSIGRFGSEIHPLHDGAYRSGMSRPATTLARMLWQAVTPDPQ